MDPAAARRYRAEMAKIVPFEIRAREAMQDGRYRDALKEFGKAEAMVKGLKIGYPANYNWQRIECYFQLKEYQQTINRINPKYRNNEHDSIRGISLIHLGRPEEAKKLWNNHMATWAVRSFDYTPYVPGTENIGQLEASFRLARGINRFLRGANKEARAEFEEALRLVPHQSLTSAYLTLALRHLNRPDLAEIYAKDAQKLSGPLHP